MSNDSVENLIEERRDYSASSLSASELAETPIAQFTQWMKHARDAKIIDASAMALATADSTGQPHVRIVLLKKFDESGFVWFTYQRSDKGSELAENPRASLLFYWCELERQVRIEGQVVALDPAEADDYFYSRPEGSRFSAAASIQSAPVANRSELESKVSALHEQYPDGNVPRPAVWGGYQLQPVRYEFWQGRDDRLHDRFIYTKTDAGAWQTQRLSP